MSISDQMYELLETTLKPGQKMVFGRVVSTGPKRDPERDMQRTRDRTARDKDMAKRPYRKTNKAAIKRAHIKQRAKMQRRKELKARVTKKPAPEWVASTALPVLERIKAELAEVLG